MHLKIHKSANHIYTQGLLTITRKLRVKGRIPCGEAGQNPIRTNFIVMAGLTRHPHKVTNGQNMGFRVEREMTKQGTHCCFTLMLLTIGFAPQSLVI